MKAKYLKFITLFISIIGVVLFLRVAMGDGDGAAVDTLINFTVFVLVAIVVVTLLMSIFSLLKNPAALKKTLIGLVVFGILFAIVYAMADGSAAYTPTNEVMLEAGSTSKLVDAGIKFSFALGIIAFALLVVDTVKSLVKS